MATEKTEGTLLERIAYRLGRIRDIDEETSDGSLGSLARRALEDLDALAHQHQEGTGVETRVAELEATNEDGFEEVVKLREQLEAMTNARDLCKRQTAQANERLQKTSEAWKHEKERAEAAQGELDRLRGREDLGPRQEGTGVGEAVVRDLVSDEHGQLDGPLGEAIAEEAGNYSLEFVTPEQIAQGFVAWLNRQPPATPEPQQEVGADRDGAEMILAERRRQVAYDGEDWTLEHDDTHDQGELVAAAIIYANPPLGSGWAPEDEAPDGWPWEPESYKPKDQISNLVRAGALIAAEIDRLQRAQPEPSQETKGEGR